MYKWFAVLFDFNLERLVLLIIIFSAVLFDFNLERLVFLINFKPLHRYIKTLQSLVS